MKKHMLLGALLAALAAAGPAHADDDDCEVPMARWQPREAVQQAVRDRGWQVERIRIDDGCYEIRGTDAQGAGFKAKLDPATLEVVEMKRRDRDREDRRHDDDDDDDDDDDRRSGRGQREGQRDIPRTPAPAPLPPPGGLLGNGAPPAATVR
ncbi:PepSY domain-containing protein [Paracoccus niistensis]|uniref:PepSY domain-containing protein n=1 Tax=Paracoccus niistensis TaxID=632935 RepID=A0ABV6HZT0_9RHOB